MYNRLCISLMFLLCFAFAKAQSQQANNIQQLQELIKNAKPGDTIVMANKEWKDVAIKLKANGTAEQPIILRAQNAGKVVLTGSTTLRLGGDYLEVHGLWFNGGDTGSNHVVRFDADSKTPARYSRLTNCAFTNVGPKDREITSYYIGLYGLNNRVDHCAITGKLNKGPAIAVVLDNSENNQHQIDHNYFGERLPLGFNGGETIRIGTSEFSKMSSKTLVENNFFEKCNGEIEIISIKSANNIIRNNLILESEGTITLRHGDYNLVEGNVIIGNNIPNAGGIRMINKGNIIQNNIIIGVQGKGYRSPIVVMNGIPDAKLNEYDQVIDGIIQNNTIINSSPATFAINTREGATATPVNTKFVNNLFYNTDGQEAIIAAGNVSGIIIEGNIASSNITSTVKGVKSVNYVMEEANNIFVPSRANDAILEGIKTSPKVRTDATGSLRSDLRVGAVVPGNFKPPLALESQAGVSFLSIGQLREMKPAVPTTEVKVAPGERTLEKAISSASGPTTLILEAGEYLLTRGNKITNQITIEGAGRDKTIIKVSEKAEKVPQYIFRMEGSPVLQVNNLTLDGAFNNEPVKYAFSSPNGTGNVPYSLKVNNVDIKGFTNKDGGAIFKAYEGTQADSVVFKNSRIINAYRGLNLSYQKDELGKVNANYILLYNTSFNNVEDYAINYLRTGVNATTPGGNLVIDHCVFYKVDDSEKGRIIEVKGIDSVHIKNTIIDNSRSTTLIVQLSGANQKIENTVIYNSGKHKTTGGAKEINVKRINPKWENSDLFTLKEDSELKLAGTDKLDIGIIHNN